MQSLRSAIRNSGGAGEPLPNVWSVFDTQRVHFRRGQLHLVAAAPGAGKSVFMQWFVGHAMRPTLYLSMDGDPGTSAIRQVQMLSGREAHEAEAAIAAGQVDDQLTEWPWISYSFSPGLDLQELELEILAYAEANGDYPEIIVVDNLMNLEVAGTDEYGGLRAAMSALHKLARRTKAAVFVLHHVVGQFEDGGAVVPMSGLNGKISKLPELIITLTRGVSGTMRASIVKNRHGEARADGSFYLELRADLARMQLTDMHILRSYG